MMKNNYNIQKGRKGITLIALVITIIVLLILAGISIIMLTGDNSILKQAGNARDLTGQKDIEERIKLAYSSSATTGLGNVTKENFENELKKEFGNDKVTDLVDDFSLVKIDGKEYETGVSSGEKDTVTKIRDKKTARGATVIELSNNDTTNLKDDYGNIVKIPKGFGIAEDSGTKVEEGIVIEDVSHTETKGSQFVWVPVGTGIKVSTKISASGTIDIPLGRYVFTTTGEVDEALSKTQPSDQLKISENSRYYYTEELTDATSNNTHAKDIVTFVSKTNSNGGYYIARYEAGISTDKDQYAYANCSGYGTSLTYGDSSKMFAKNGDIKPLSIKGKGVWNAVTQGEAAIISRNMYNTTNDKVTSDLINSYAWDTAILYIEKCGTNNNYANKLGSGTIKQTGNSSDEQCKINDMAGNAFEWTTETGYYASYTFIPCVYRGGDSGAYTALRINLDTEYSYLGASFRPLLYL